MKAKVTSHGIVEDTKCTVILHELFVPVVGVEAHELRAIMPAQHDETNDQFRVLRNTIFSSRPRISLAKP